ncbi:unnamed protein product [Pieris macdunnoughi]|uniref:Uncharacterized protein n=1 Tax=Pieris macdunnoughi TaxID=345717 RepID=A0A821T367_9NEOP|nr:unnamed protein product [Pieris macdunnoughi]
MDNTLLLYLGLEFSIHSLYNIYSSKRPPPKCVACSNLLQSVSSFLKAASVALHNFLNSPLSSASICARVMHLSVAAASDMCCKTKPEGRGVRFPKPGESNFTYVATCGEPLYRCCYVNEFIVGRFIDKCGIWRAILAGERAVVKIINNNFMVLPICTGIDM